MVSHHLSCVYYHDIKCVFLVHVSGRAVEVAGAADRQGHRGPGQARPEEHDPGADRLHFGPHRDPVRARPGVRQGARRKGTSLWQWCRIS